MYLRSSSPSWSTTCWRMASSSQPSASICSSLSGTVRLVSPVLAVMCQPLLAGGSDVDLDVTDGYGHAELDLRVGLGVQFAGAEIAGAAGQLGAGAGEADAHPAAVLRCQPGPLGLFEQRRAAVHGTDTARREPDLPADLGAVRDAHG